MDLPIDLVPNSSPPRFVWKQTIDTPVGQRTIQHEGQLAPNVEMAIVSLIATVKRLLAEKVK